MKKTKKEKDQELICLWVRRLKNQGFSSDQISRLLDEIVSPRTINRWISGSTRPKNTKGIFKPLSVIINNLGLLQLTTQDKKQIGETI